LESCTLSQASTVSEDQHVTNLTAAPDPAHPEDYNDQYTTAVQRINPVDRLPTEYDLQAGDDIIANAGKRNAVAKALEVHQDGSAMVQWHNTKKLNPSPTAAYYPSWYTPKAKHGETASSTGDMPSWDIWLDRATIQFRFLRHCQTYTGSFCVFGPVLSSPAHGTPSLAME
jgi:hypothetical protein